MYTAAFPDSYRSANEISSGFNCYYYTIQIQIVHDQLKVQINWKVRAQEQVVKPFAVDHELFPENFPSYSFTEKHVEIFFSK